MGKIDIVGHFGTTLSYATVGSRVARALLDAGILGAVTNLDDEWGPYEDLQERTPVFSSVKGSHVVIFSAPRHYFDVYIGMYGRANTAIFMSPNSDTLLDEHAQSCSQFGTAIVPSKWCSETVQACATPDRITRLPLGIDQSLLSGRVTRMRAPHRDAPLSVWHFTTDQVWPGRKGTEELLKAWQLVSEMRAGWSLRSGGLASGVVARPAAKLYVHAPPGLSTAVHYQAADMGIFESVEIVTGAGRGSADGDLAKHVHSADLIVQPSRCEGFGLMMLAALAAGIPLVTTSFTGQTEYLRDFPGAWLGVPTDLPALMAYEEGSAPKVSIDGLVNALMVAMTADARTEMIVAASRHGATAWSWTWDRVLIEWVEWAKSWTTEEST